jgi:uncharacterized protein (TIGR00106 family)
MKVTIDFCLIPMSTDLSISKYIAACQQLLAEAGLSHQMHAFGTNVEGEWDEVFAVVKKCHEKVHEMGAVRISTSMRVGTRTDREQSLQDKIDSVTSKLRTR